MSEIEQDWAQLGVLFGCTPSGRTPDLERLLLETARACPSNARLVPLTVTWLASYGAFVARHRLKRLTSDELDEESKPILALLLDEAVRHGAARDLLIVSDACRPRKDAQPLAMAQQDNGPLASIAARHASEISRTWGVLCPPVTPKFDAIRPVSWLLERNPAYRDRVIRKGDLRVSVMETLRLDLVEQSAPSESALTRLSGATRTAVRKALASLVLEGVVSVGTDAPNDRDHPVRLLDAA